jgi:single-stranded-DNA-specific exonuclease
VRWVEVAYKLDVNEFRGRESVQLMVAHLAPR